MKQSVIFICVVGFVVTNNMDIKMTGIRHCAVDSARDTK